MEKESVNLGNAFDLGDIPKVRKVTGARKAAILLITLGADVAADIVKNLPDQYIQKIGVEISNIHKVGTRERREILQEFIEVNKGQDIVLQGGMDFAKSLLNGALGNQRANKILEGIKYDTCTKLFMAARKAEPEQILSCIQGESTQTIAIILSHLQPDKAAVVLSEIPDDIKHEVSLKIGGTSSISPNIIKAIDEAVTNKLSKLGQRDLEKSGGVDSLIDILSNVDRKTEKSIIKYIEENREVKDYFLSEELGYSYLPNPKNVEETPIVNVISMNDKFIENMSVKLKEGRLPENDTELAISTRINEKFNTNYKVGDTITLNINETEQNMENGISKTYKIVGIIERPILAIESYYVDWFTAITKMQNVNKKANIAVLYNKPKDYIKNTENINNMTKTENNEDGVSFSGLSNKYKSYKYNLMVNKELLAYEGASLDDETLKTIYGLGAFIIGIVLVSSVFVIRNGFEISITERLK